MPAPTTIAVYQADLQPLQGRWARAWGTSLGASKDTTIERARQAVLVGAVTRAPDDALPLLGADVSLEQLPGEADAAYRTRILGAWDVWPWAGTRTGLVNVFAQLNPSGSTRIATATELSREPWAQWWAFVTQPSPLVRRVWGAPAVWGVGIWGAENPVDGATNADRALVRTVRRLARQFSNARDRGWVVILTTDPGVWGAPAVWGAPGVWGARNPRWRI